ncbi:MAG: hypothetical protein FWG03_00415 [Clostridiales bacterium]|nr:hypothetical protein [Clostridiales bacterium]
MKQFIVLAAILPILLVFVAQFTLEAGRGLRMNAAEDAVRAFCIEAAYFDGGGPAEAEALRMKLARIFNVDIRDVAVELKNAGDAHIDWFVSFPVGDIMAGAPFMGLTPAENRGRAQMNGTIVIAPPPLAPTQDDTAPPGQDEGGQDEGEQEEGGQDEGGQDEGGQEEDG